MSNTTSPLRIHSSVAESIVDGPGIRSVIFTQGCPHHCPGCHNPQTHDFAGGSLVDTQAIVAEILTNPLLTGVTFSGGEPFCQPAPLAEIARAVHTAGLDVVAYTGYTLEQLVAMAETDPAICDLLLEIDLLIDGPFILAERDLTLQFRGSRNQRFLDRSEIHQAMTTI
ncbi:MAG: anaerobic ribonucleoside-triphosphate reductase activating protein [Clostridia bacterium]|nr:anaerobic ribonucleoside-triphosphate reductase activating protein [Clostridia bacterium]